MNIAYGYLTIRALWELTRYEVVNFVFGFGTIHRQMVRHSVTKRKHDAETVRRVCEAVSLAACFYWKPVLCLQRSVAAARLLRKYGVHGHLVIGYRPSPFFSHAWVEVDDRVVNDSPGYKQRLIVLSTA